VGTRKLPGPARRVWAALLAACLLLALAGCGPEPAPVPETPSPTPAATPPPEPAQFALACYPDSSFHPLAGDNRTNLSLGGLIYEGLFALDQQFQPHAVLCEGYTASEDARTWTFTLRTGVSFSDGTPLAPSHVADSLNQARTSGLYAPRLAGISGVRAGDGAVTVTLSAPNGALPALLDVPICLGGGDRPLGTGPYVLEEGEDGLFLQARTGWWQGSGLPKDRIPLRALRGPDELIQAFDTQEVSLVSTDLTSSNALGFSGSSETADYPTSTMLFVGFNLRQGPCREPAVRQAVQRGADRGAIAAALLSRHGAPAALPAAPGCPLYPREIAQDLDFSLSAVEEILTDGGWSRVEEGYQKGRQQLALVLAVCGDNAGHVAVAQRLAEDLGRAGVPVEVRRLSWEAYVDALERGEFDLYLGQVRMTADFDPSVLMAAGGALNYGGYGDRETLELLEQFRSAAGQVRALAAKRLYQRMAQEPPFVTLCFKNGSVLTQWRQISGLTPTQQNVFYRFADWTIA